MPSRHPTGPTDPSSDPHGGGPTGELFHERQSAWLYRRLAPGRHTTANGLRMTPNGGGAGLTTWMVGRLFCVALG